MTSTALLLLIKVSLVLAAVLGAAHVMRRASASARHRLWSAAFAALLLLPLLAAVLPELSIAIPSWAGPAQDAASQTVAPPRQPVGPRMAAALPVPEVRSFGQVEPEMPMEAAAPVRAFAMPGLSALLAGVWAAGAVLAAGLLLIALWRVRRVTRGAVALDDEAWTAAARETADRFGMRAAPRVLISDRVTTPMAGGLLRPTVFVPAEARGWDAECRGIVLAHEIAHLARRDPLRQIVTRLVVACYWFHPLAWVAARQAEAAREQACDEAVLALGTRPSTYARVLLDFADALGAPAPVIAALPIVQRSLLEKRLMAILNDDVRPRARTLVLLPVFAVTLLTITVAAAHPARPSKAAFAVASAPQPAAGVEAPVAPIAPVTAPLTPIDAVTPADDQRGDDRDSACGWEFGDGSSFSGSMTINDEGGRSVIVEQAGRRGGTRIMQKTFGDTRVCMLAEGVGDRDGAPSAWIGGASRVVLESKRGRERRSLEIEGARLTWSVNGDERAPDAEAAEWRARMLAVLDPAWELAALRGEESSLRGEISSIHGERSSLHGEISSLYGEVSSMRGEISSIRGEESSLRGEMSSIQGELSSMRGEISSEHGEISSLNAERYGATDAERRRIEERIKRHEAAIARLEQRIREYDAPGRLAAVERRLADYDADGRVAQMERRLREFDVEAKVRTVQERIAALDVEGKVAELERRIAALNVEGRAKQIEARLDAAVRALNR